MEQILQSFLVVAATEMGDKTQLLAFLLASRFKKPWTVFWGILVATILNHALSAVLGQWVAHQLDPNVLKWILALAFFGFAIWVLFPDKEDAENKTPKWGAFLTTVVVFFMAEMGDKTQLSTIALAAKFQNIYTVTIGTTLGMMFSDGLAVFFGDKLTKFVDLKWIRIFCAALFVVMGIAILIRGVT